MEYVADFLKEAGIYYLGTVEEDKPVLRPFGTVHCFENRLYFQTGRGKAVYRQLKENPNICICAMHKGRWVRIEAEAQEDPRVEAEASLLEAYPSLGRMYAPGDGNTAVFYLQNATAAFYSFTAPPEIHHF